MEWIHVEASPFFSHHLSDNGPSTASTLSRRSHMSGVMPAHGGVPVATRVSYAATVFSAGNLAPTHEQHPCSRCQRYHTQQLLTQLSIFLPPTIPFHHLPLVPRWGGFGYILVYRHGHQLLRTALHALSFPLSSPLARCWRRPRTGTRPGSVTSGHTWLSCERACVKPQLSVCETEPYGASGTVPLHP